MRFSKKMFLKNAPMEIRRRLKGDLDVLDGMKVMFDRGCGTGGLIPLYFSGTQEYCLYPVEEEWCV